MRGPFISILRSFFAGIDASIYGFIETIMRAIFDLASINLELELVDEVRTRVYVLLGVFMMVRLMFSFISYMVNPEKMVDKNVGASKIFVKLIISIAMLMIVPFLFDYMTRAQTSFLPMVPRIILGREASEDIGADATKQSKGIALYVLQTFYHPYRDPSNNYASVEGAKDIESIEEFQKTVEEPAVKGGILGLGAKGYKYNYYFGISTIVGGYLLFKLIEYAIKIAVRLIKLLILEVIAPIPIMSMPMVDISIGKNKGDFSFKKWLSEVATVFLEIFIYMGFIYIVVFLLGHIASNSLYPISDAIEGLNIDPMRKRAIDVLFILALIKFLDDVPAYIKSILSPNKAETTSHLFGGLYGGLKGSLIGAAGGFVSTQRAAGVIAGAVGGANEGVDAARKGKTITVGQSLTAGADTAYQSYTGNPKSKFALGAATMNMATRSLSRRHMEDLGINEHTINEAKQMVRTREDEYDNAQANYDNLQAIAPAVVGVPVNEARYKDKTGEEAVKTYREDVNSARNAVKSTKAAYEKSKGNYEEAKGAWKDAKLSDTIDDKYNKQFSHQARKKAVKGFNDTISKARTRLSPTGKSIEERRRERTQKSINKGGFDPYK